MATRTAAKRKPNTALVFNPKRGLSIGGRSTVRKARRNPTRRVATKAIENPRKRRRSRRRNPAGFSVLRNPASGVSGLLMASVFAGGAITLIDTALARVAPGASPTVQILIKAGLALAFQSPLGNKVPLFGKYKNDIALVLGVMAGAQAIRLWVLPMAQQTFNQVTGQVQNLLAPPPAATTQGTMGNIHGNARLPLSYYGVRPGVY